MEADRSVSFQTDTVIVGIVIWFVLKEAGPATVKAEAGKPSTGNHSMRWSDVPKIFAYRNCTLSYVANVLIMIGFWGVVSFGTTYWVDEVGLTLAQDFVPAAASVPQAIKPRTSLWPG